MRTSSLISLGGLLAFAAFTGCGDSSSAPSAPTTTTLESSPSSTGNSSAAGTVTDSLPGTSSGQVPTSSELPPGTSSGQVPTSSEPYSSSSVSPETAVSSSSEEPVPESSAEATPVVSLDENGFATVADVYHSLAPSERAVFIIRHSEREDDVAIETELTQNGVKMAQDLGATLKSDEEFTYITSGFVRTNETANQISVGRGEASLPKIITNYDITGNWFLKISAEELASYATKLGMQGSSVELMAHWAYGEAYPDALYELEPRAQEFMETVILKNLPKWKRVSIMVSHDIFVMPLAVFGSDKKVALKYHEDYHWINYIAGLAVIIDENNNLRYVPVKGADSGVIDYLAIYMAEHGYGNTH